MIAPAPSPAAPHWLAYQRRWITDDSPLKLWEKSRRIGADFCDAFASVRERITGERTTDLWYSSADESAALEYMQYVRRFASMYGTALELVSGEELFDRDMLKVFSVRFPNQSRITAMTSSPRSFRSKGGDVCLSEFAFHADAEALWKAAAPVTTWGGRLRVLTTHNGKDSVFNRRLTDARKGRLKASVHRVTIDDAIADGLVERINQAAGTDMTREAFRDDLRNKCQTEHAFREEYLCEPSDEDSSYLPYGLTRLCVHEDAAAPTDDVATFLTDVSVLGSGTSLYAGCDVGRRVDKFCVWVVARFGTVLRTVGVLRFTGRPFATMESALMSLMSLQTLPQDGEGQRLSPVRVTRLCIDETGIGMQLAERVHDKHRHRVERVSFTAAVKAELITLLRRDVEERTVTLPDDEATLADFASIRRTVTTAGNVRFDAERTREGHGDEAVACALALHAAENNKGTVRFAHASGGVM